MITAAKEKGYTKILGSYELTLIDATLLNPIDITFNVGTEYNDKTVYVLHKKADGTMETFENAVIDGMITVTVTELSPFGLAVKEDTATTPSKDSTNVELKGEDSTTALKVLPKAGTNTFIITIISLITCIILSAGILKIKNQKK